MKVSYEGPEGTVLGEATEREWGYVGIYLIESTTHVAAGCTVEVKGTFKDLLALPGWKEVN